MNFACRGPATPHRDAGLKRLAITVLMAGMAAGAQSPTRRAPMLPLQYGLPVTGEPFSGVRVLEFEPSDATGSVRPVHGEEKIWRDSAGRTRSEIRYNGQLGTVDILDFVTKKHYHWAMGDNIFSTLPMPEPRAGSTPVRTEPPLDADAPKIEGVPTRHSHDVRGDNEDSREVVESWYAPSLHLAMLTIVDRPAFGKTTYRFEHVELREPDAALFKPPQGMNAVDPKAPPPVPTAGTALQTRPSGSGSPPTDPRMEAGQPAAPEPGYKSDPKFQKAIDAAGERGLASDERLARWKKTFKLSDNQCVDCFRRVIALQMSAQQWKDAANTARQMSAVAVRPNDKGYAQASLGSCLMNANNGAPKPDQLQEADATFTAALAISPRSAQVIYSEGRVLSMLGRDADAKAMFQRYLDRVGEADRYRARAEHFVENPHLASLPMAPPFTLTTAEGEQISLDEQVGKVVLLDFWATWCGPCKQTLPEIHSIAKKFAGQPLVVVSISSDSNDVAWKDFISKNDMFWAQYRDADHALSNAYGVSAIPRFFTIDSDGVLQSVKVGSGADVEGDLKKLVKRASQEASRKAASTDKPAGEE